MLFAVDSDRKPGKPHPNLTLRLNLLSIAPSYKPKRARLILCFEMWFNFFNFFSKLRGKGKLHLPPQPLPKTARVVWCITRSKTSSQSGASPSRCLTMFYLVRKPWVGGEFLDHFSTARISRDCFKQLFNLTFKIILMALLLSSFALSCLATILSLTYSILLTY